jgi:hypothetical protein
LNAGAVLRHGTEPKCNQTGILVRIPFPEPELIREILAREVAEPFGEGHEVPGVDGRHGGPADDAGLFG